MDPAFRVAPNLSNGATGFHFEINCQAQSVKCGGLWLAPLLPLSMITACGMRARGSHSQMKEASDDANGNERTCSANQTANNCRTPRVAPEDRG
jgi:hypothetical protein